PGDLLVDRFRIMRQIAERDRGGVYEAHDLELGERIAVKTISVDGVARSTFLERLRREIRLARKVTHPNRCRVFEVFEQSSPDGEDITFVTMELLDGETLSSRIEREGPMTESAALPIVRQLVAALTAAHQADVVHRDLKSSNVMLVPSRPASTA